MPMKRRGNETSLETSKLPSSIPIFFWLERHFSIKNIQKMIKDMSRVGFEPTLSDENQSLNLAP
jgi:hypothetical protein